MHSAYHQSRLAWSRQSVERALESSELTEEQKRKLRLAQAAKAFGEAELGLKATENYTTYVHLDDPYVTYILQAAHAHELKPYHWHFPFVGAVPYKGYFQKSLAEDERKRFDPETFDTYVRGVSAYSTLGWFKDSILSSMLRYDDEDLVETILHETTHTTLFIKSAAEFNERMATYLGHEGMKLFFLKTEGPDSPHLKAAAEQTVDQKLFSAFLTEEIRALEQWYQAHKGAITKELKASRLKEIQTRFTQNVLPNLKTKAYADFNKRELNNAILLALKTYQYSLEDFEKLHKKLGGDFSRTLAWLKTLEKDPKPDQTLKSFVEAP